MVNDKINDTQIQSIYDKYENGYYIKLAQETIVKGYNLAGLFPKIEVTGSKATVVDETPIDKFVDQTTGKKLKTAEGAEARRIRGLTVTPGGLELTYEELIYEISNEDLANPSVNISREIQSLSYLFADYINKEAVKTCKEEATEYTDNKIVGNWDTPTTEFISMARDIRKMKDAWIQKPYNMDLIAMGAEADFELDTKAAKETLPYQIPATGFTIDNALQVFNTNCFYGGKGLDAGDLIGFDSKNPGLNMIFQKFENPNVKPAPVVKGLEQLAPPIQMLMYDNSDEEVKPTTTIKMACSFGFYPVAHGEKMVKLNKSVIG